MYHIKSNEVVWGYIRRHNPFYPKDLVEIVYNFYLIPIVNYQIQTIGLNNFKQQGFGHYHNVKTLKTVKKYQKTIKNIINGYWCVYIIFTDNTYECCGNNKYGQLGLNHSDNTKTFVKNNNYIKINQIFTNPFSFHAFCLDNNNNIYSCGQNYNNKWTQINTPIKIQQVSTAYGYTTFINNNGQLFVCGKGPLLLGLGLGKDIKQVDQITQIKIKSKFINIYCGESHTLALDYNGQIWSWGYGLYGQLGHGNTLNGYKPTQIQYFIHNNIKIIQICCGNGHNLVLSNNFKIYAFGYNKHYECGNSDSNENVLVPQLIFMSDNIINIKCGSSHNMVKTNANGYYLWGYNRYNQCLETSQSIIYVKKPLIFEYKKFISKSKVMIDMFLGLNSTRILIGNININENKQQL